MTTPGHEQSLRPTFSVYKPIIDTTASPVDYTPEGEFIDSLVDNVDSYQHTIGAVGGYWSASFTIRDRQERIESWIDTGLGRYIRIYDETLSVIWEGFVNRISANLGPLSIVRGPLMDVSNSVNLVYSTVDTSTTPPTVGMRVRTGAQDDTDSQDRYAILETYLSSGGATDTMATEARNQYLEERKDPKTTQTVSLGRGTPPSVRVDCLGYVHWFNEYVYNQTANTGTENADAKIQAVINAQLNAIFDTTMSEIDTNALAVKRYENKDRTAWDVIKSILALGDTSDNRWLFGIYANRMPHYNQAPTTIEYNMRLADAQQRIEAGIGERVYPWNVLPGQWLKFTDLFVGRTTPTTLRLDPRAMFIETVTYTAPWGLNLKGGDTDKLPQKLAKMGLAGIGG